MGKVFFNGYLWLKYKTGNDSLWKWIQKKADARKMTPACSMKKT
jgi:hypothetical protein